MSLVNTDNNFRTAEFSSELRMKVKLNLYWYHGRKDSALNCFVAGDVENTEGRGSDKSVEPRIVVRCLPQCDEDTTSEVGHS